MLTATSENIIAMRVLNTNNRNRAINNKTNISIFKYGSSFQKNMLILGIVTLIGFSYCIFSSNQQQKVSDNELQQLQKRGR